MPGETGRVVITPIFQTAQPLIRYQQGDLATVGWPCSCGRCSPTLGGVVGRTISVFSRPDGQAKVITYLADSVRELLNCETLQLAQTGPNAYEVRYQPKSNGQRANEAEAASEIRRETLWSDSEITFVHRAPRQGAPDKAVDFVNEWDSDLLATS
jgi:phenylacetate-CoA ligase